jgi:hypothetical protein
VRVVCGDEVALRLVDPIGRIALNSRDSSSTGIPGCSLIRPYEDGNWEAGTEDANADSMEVAAADTTMAMAGASGFSVRAPKVGEWRLEATVPPDWPFKSEVWLNVRVRPRGGVLTDLKSSTPWVTLGAGQLGSCTLRLGRDGTLVRTRTKVSRAVARAHSKEH